MLNLLKLQIFSGLLMLFMAVSPGYAQSETIDFIWEDKEDNKNSGTLLLDWENDVALNQWKLQITASWYDISGEAINDLASMPFIYLSEYDLEIPTETGAKCLNFSVSNSIYDLQFQDSGELRFSLPPGMEKPGDFEIKFKYSLSAEDMDQGHIDPLNVPARSKIVISFPDTRIKQEETIDDKDIVSLDTSNQLSIQGSRENCQVVREKLNKLSNTIEDYNIVLTEEDQKLAGLQSDISSMEMGDSIARDNIETALMESLLGVNNIVRNVDSLGPQLNQVETLLRQKVFPEDSLNDFRGELVRLNDDYRTLRDEFVQSRKLIRTLREGLGGPMADDMISSQKKFLERRYKGIFKSHLDSIQDIQSSYSQIEPGLLNEIRKGPRKAQDNAVLENFKQSHELLKLKLDSLKEFHSREYLNYRDGIEETGEIIPLENLHVRFGEIYNNTDGSIGTMDLEISRLEASINERNPRPTARKLLIGGVVLFLIILILVIRRFAVVLKKFRTSGVKGMPSISTTDGGGFGMIDEGLEESADYYKVIVPQDHPDMVLTEVHFHIRTIKSVYHLIQAALLEKKPDNFGGLLFGRQYKATNNGNGSENGRYILIVEQLVEAESIRPGMEAGLEKGAKLVEEIEKLVKKNKKMALLGWFTSSVDKDLEMSENLVKVHRTYFRDKKHLAFLVHPVTENLQTGLFVRRKSGFFDTIPSEECRLNWDEMYQFALDPPLKSELEEKKKPDSRDYLKIDLNQNWCDSIVEVLHMHPSVLLEVLAEKESKEQIAAGQVANGFFYGEVWPIFNEEGEPTGFEVYIDKLVVASNSENPRELPGSKLLGWLKFDKSEIFESLKIAIPYHNEVFPSAHQLALLINTQTDELRFFSRKHSMEMNNNTIETEEFNLSTMVADAKALLLKSENKTSS